MNESWLNMIEYDMMWLINIKYVCDLMWSYVTVRSPRPRRRSRTCRKRRKRRRRRLPWKQWTLISAETHLQGRRRAGNNPLRQWWKRSFGWMRLPFEAFLSSLQMALAGCPLRGPISSHNSALWSSHARHWTTCALAQIFVFVESKQGILEQDQHEHMWWGLWVMLCVCGIVHVGLDNGWCGIFRLRCHSVMFCVVL